MKSDVAAGGPPGLSSILTARTLANSHPTLLDHLARGVSVLDVGCGPGTLTAEIARRVAPGHVVGMDVNPEMIRAAEAASPPGEIPGLVFYRGDIRESEWDAEFDLANAARILSWLPDPEAAVARMVRAVAPGGRVVLLDRDHTRARWSGAPEAWTDFYSAFLGWRAAQGLDNAIARRLPALARAAGLVEVEVTPLVTTVRAGEPDFFRVAGAWRMMIESRGRHVVTASRLTEAGRRAALDAFTAWMEHPGSTQTTHEVCVVTRRKEER